MLQRIQTVYLLMVTGLMSVMFFLPLATFINNSSQPYIFNIIGLYKPEGLFCSTWPLELIVTLVGVLSLVTVFLYKRRLLQTKICIFNVILLLVFYGLVLYYYTLFKNESIVNLTPGFSFPLPLIALILDLMAIRSIRKDEALVKSLDRIR